MARETLKVTNRSGQDGSRWLNAAPTGEEIAAWFRENVFLHDERLDHGHYVQGVTLIPNEEKVKVVEGDLIVRRAQLVFTPYSKVETRIRYFWDYVGLHEDWVGEISPVEVKRITAQDVQRLPQLEGLLNEHLPPGYFRFPVPDPKTGKRVEQLGCTMRVRIWKTDLRTGSRGRLIFDPPPGTKIVSLYTGYADNPYVDENAVMKAETGAVGRALGMAGMLVLPGSGVATAEDMADLEGLAPIAPPEAQAPQLPGADEGSGDIRTRMETLLAELQSDPDAFEEFGAWATGKNIDLEAVNDDQVRPVVRQLEKKVAK